MSTGRDRFLKQPRMQTLCFQHNPSSAQIRFRLVSKPGMERSSADLAGHRSALNSVSIGLNGTMYLMPSRPRCCRMP